MARSMPTIPTRTRTRSSNMASFFGRLRGSRGETTRLGSKESGIHAVTQSWEGSVAVDMYLHDGEVWCCIRVEEGSTGQPSIVVYAGSLAHLLNENSRVLPVRG